jgi:hypothetical protein
MSRHTFFEIRPANLKALSIVVLILLAIVFKPTIEWALDALQPLNTIYNDRLDTIVPRRWMGRIYEGALEEWTPCLTIFCAAPRSSIKIQSDSIASGRDVKAWASRIEQSLGAKGFSNATRRRLYGAVGAIDCVQMRKANQIPGTEACLCYAPGPGMTAGFEGDPADLNDFYLIISAVGVTSGRRETTQP